MPLREVVTDLVRGAEALQRHRYGVIEVTDGRLVRIVLRPLPKIVSWPGVILGGVCHGLRSGDSARLYYNRPWRFPNFLVLKYAESARGASMASLTCGLAVLDEIARLNRSDALLCDAANRRITARCLARYGWQPHCPSWFHRNFIKRFYGEYPSRPAWMG